MASAAPAVRGAKKWHDRKMNRTLRRHVRVAAATLALAAAAAGANPPPAPLDAGQIARIVASPERSDADRTNDRRRKPEQMLAFIGVRPGMVALDIVAAGGYTSELLARAVGPGGTVYAQGTAPPRATLAARIANPRAGHIVAAVRPFEDPAPPEVANGGLDLATLMFNYHDLAYMGVDRERMNRAVFAALRPGGTYVIADHSARPGTAASEARTLHRIDEALVRDEVERAGFKLAAEGQFLRNPADPRDRETPDPPMPKDEFVLKFVKP